MELQNYFDTLENPPAKSSQLSYKSQYRYIRKSFDVDLIDVSVEDILIYLDSIEKLNTKKNLLNIFIMLKKNKVEDYEVLTALREEYKEKIKTELGNTNEKLEEKLNEVSYEDLMEHLKKSKDDTYIINYILLNYYTRNKDLDLVIVKEPPENEDVNYILINEDGKSVIYERNNYKTIKSHGKKTHIIKDKKFIKYCISLLGDKDSVRLLKTKQLNPSIVAHTLNNMNENEYFKIQVLHFRNQKYSTKKLYEMGECRGTSIDYILTNYNVQYQN